MRRRILVPTILGTKSYTQKIRTLFGTSIIGHWPLDDPVGSSVARDISGNGYNGTPTNVTFGAVGIGDGRTAATFNGTSSGLNVYSAGLAGAFNGEEGSFLVWFTTAAWTDGTVRFLFRFFADDNNYVGIQKIAANNTLLAEYEANNIYESVTQSSYSPSGWVSAAVTWSNAAEEFKFFLSGSQVGSTSQFLGTWAGALAEAGAKIGLPQINNFYWSGSIAHAILTNTAATPTQIAGAASV